MKNELDIAIVSEPNNPGFLLTELNEVFTYRTPQHIIDFINANCIIGNPPFNVKS